MTMYTTPIEQISDGRGDPIAGAKKFLFNVGTTTKKTIFSDSALTIARANPVISDADGRFPQFFLDGLYDEVQQDNTGTATGYDGVTLWGPLPVGTVAEGALTLWATDNTYNIPDIVLGSDDSYYQSLIDTNTGNNPTSSAGSWEKLQFGRVWNSTITYAKNDTVYASDGMLYISTAAANLANNPPIASGKWRPATNQNQSAIGAGTADAITAVMPIPLQALNDEIMVTIRASAANATTTPTFSPDGLTAKTITKNGNQPLIIGDIFGAGHELQLKYNLTNDKWELMNPISFGKIIQKETYIRTTHGTGTAIIPMDDTIPQITEGTEFLALSFTPKFNNSILYIESSCTLFKSTGSYIITALFKDAGVDAISSNVGYTLAADAPIIMTNNHSIVSGTTSAINFTVRGGSGNAATTAINGFIAGRYLGGSLSSSITITEVMV